MSHRLDRVARAESVGEAREALAQRHMVEPTGRDMVGRIVVQDLLELLDLARRLVLARDPAAVDHEAFEARRHRAALFTHAAAPPQPGPGSQSCRSLPPSCLTLSLSWRLFLSAAARVASWRIVFLRALCRAVCPAPSLCDQCVSVPACISRSETPPSLHVRPSTLPPPPPAPLGTFIPLAYQDDASSKSRAARVACDHGRGGDRQQRRAGGGPRLWPGRSYFRNGLALSPSVLQSLTRGASHFFSSLTGAPVLRPFLPGHA